MPKNKNNSRTKRARQAKAASNTNNAAANQSSNANNPPPNVPPQPTELLSNQNLQNSAASAAVLPLLQQINFSSTNANINTSNHEAMDTSYSVSPQASQPALQINSSSSSQPEAMDISNPVSPQASPLGSPTNSSTSSSSSSSRSVAMDTSEPVSPQATPYDVQIANQQNLINRLKQCLGTSVTSFTTTNKMKVKLDDDQYEEIAALFLMNPNISRHDWVNLIQTTDMIKYTLASLIDQKIENVLYHLTSKIGICQRTHFSHIN